MSFRRAIAALDFLTGGAAVLAVGVATAGSFGEGAEIAAPFAIGLFFARFGGASVTGDTFRESPRAKDAVRRLVGVYAAIAGVTLITFPEVGGAGQFLFFAFAHAVMQTCLSDPYVRAAADWNAAFLVGAANAAGGPVFGPTLAYLGLLPIGLALRRFEDAALAAEVEGPADLRPALAVGVPAGVALAAFYALAVLLLPAGVAAAPHAHAGAALPRNAPAVPWAKIPWGRIGELAAAAGSALGALAAYARFMRRSRAAPREGGPEGEGVTLGRPEQIAREAAPPEPPTPAGPRAAVVAEYRRFADELAALDLGRAPSEGAGEHAQALARRYARAAADLGEVAERFAEARYGAADVPDEAADEVREAARRALEEIRRR